jgi:methionyl-tRNA formyltransferase
MKVVFMGSDAFSVPTLQVLTQKHQVLLVVTQPDKPTGRGLKLAANPVKTAALELGLPLSQPARLKNADFQTLLQEVAPDVVVVVAYGKIIPPAVLQLPRYGCINVHGSILPEYRGAAPIERALVNGEAAGGITTFYMNEGLDSGDVILMRTTEFGEAETGGEIRERLSHVGAELLDETLQHVAAGTAPRVPQDLTAGQGTYSPTIKNAETWIDWSQPASRIANTVRAFFPHPGTQTTYRGQILKLKHVTVSDTKDKAAPGTLLSIVKNQGWVVACGDGAVMLHVVQPAGKKWMSAWALAQGARPQPGEILTGAPAPKTAEEAAV